MENLYKLIGQKIRKIRKSQSMTLEDLSSKANLDWSFLAKIETGKSVPSLKTIFSISKALNIKPLQLFETKKFDEKDIIEENILSVIRNLSNKDKKKIFEIIKIIIQ